LFVEEKAQGTNKNIDRFYTKTTQKGGFSLLTTLEFLDYIFFSKKTDMKFIILVSNLKEISPSVFS
jgi:hypothetical protein